MPTIAIHGNYGFSASFGLCPPVEPKPTGQKRGLCTEWTSASQRRFREFCVTHDTPYMAWGITFTIPSIAIWQHWYFANVWHDFSRRLNRIGVPLVWRFELQQRGQPHAHCVVYTNVKTNVLEVIDAWYKSLTLKTICALPCLGEFVWLPCRFAPGANHSVYVERLSGDHRAYRYLVSHSTKSKQVQLGYRGRNWGVVNRALFDEVQTTYLPIEESDYWQFLRWVRRLSRRRRATSCRAWLCNPYTVKRMLVFLGYSV